MRGLQGRDASGKEITFAPKPRNHYRNAVVQLFNYARDRGYLPKGMPTEVEGVKPLNVVVAKNEIFTVVETVTLLEKAPARLIPALVIKAFSGVRTEEMVRPEVRGAPGDFSRPTSACSTWLDPATIPA